MPLQHTALASLPLVSFKHVDVPQVPLFMTLASCAIAFAVIISGYGREIRSIPSVGVTDGTGLLSYIDVFRFLSDSNNYLDWGLGTLKSRVQAIRIPTLFGWTVVVTDKALYQECKDLPEDVASATTAFVSHLEARYTFGDQPIDNPYHITMIKNRSRRSLPTFCPRVYDEISAAFDEYLDGPINEWRTYPTGVIGPKVVARASNRVIVGLPLCRNEDFIKICTDYTLNVVKTSAVLKLVPAFLRRSLARLLPTIRNSLPRALKHLQPVITHRQEQQSLLAKDYEAPDDMLGWLMSEAEGNPEETTPAALTARVLLLNFAVIHTSTAAFLQSLYDLAAHPEYIEPLRAEVSAVIGELDWTKQAIDKLVMVDSFMKESLRLRPLAVTTVAGRQVLQDFHLGGPSGPHIPKGTLLKLDMKGFHRDPEVYPNPQEFQPWRFLEPRPSTDRSGSVGAKRDLTALSPDWMFFGYGRHACPGRFFAALEIKLMLAYLIMHYDIKCEVDRVRPREIWIGPVSILDPNARLMFRRRSVPPSDEI